MFINIIKIASRILFRNKIFSLINILGLSMGLACSILILSIVRQELSFDRFHENVDHIFCLQQTMDLGTGMFTTDQTGGACGPALVEAFPEITRFVRLSRPMELLLTVDPVDSPGQGELKKFMEEGVLAVDSNFLSVFSFRSTAGNADRALDDPYALVVTEEMAEKYFGINDPIGQRISINASFDFIVSAVVEKPPINSTIQFDFLVNFGFLEELDRDISSFDGNPYFTFLCLDDPSQAAGMDSTITLYLDDYQSDDMAAVQKLQPLVKLHNRGEAHGKIVITVFTILGAIILAIACINFMNLSTARYLSRTREVGIRKTAGARRTQLILQFIGETMIITFISMNLAILLIDSFLPLFNRYFDLEVTFSLKDPAIFSGLLIIFIITSMLSGSYPAFFLSSFSPVIVLGKMKMNKKRGGGIRKVLVVVQFFFAALFILTSFVNFKQFQLLENRRNSVDAEGVIYLPVRGDLRQHYQAFKDALLLNPSIESVTSASTIPKSLENGEFNWGLTVEENNDIAMILNVHYDFEKTFRIEMEAGRFYSPDHPGDSANGIIINRNVADALGLEDPVGRIFWFRDVAFTIIGIIEDYSFSTLALAGQKAIIPFSEDNGLLFIRTTGVENDPVISYIGEMHEKFNPDYPFDYFFMDEFTDQFTEGMGLAKRVVYFFTLFGIFISCLGLLGLSIYSTEQRTKEIGIRKAVGATSRSILRLIITEFMKLILLSLVISIPVSIYLHKYLLQLFSDRVRLGPGLFLITAALLMFVALLTISIQALRSALSNPAESLRYE